MSNTDGEDTQRIEDVDGFSFSKGYTSGFEAGEKQLKATRKVVASQNKELASLREQLKQKDQRIKFVEELLNEDLHEENKSLKSELKQQEEVIRELIPLARMFVVHKEWMGEECKTEKAIIEKAKSLTTKDK